HHPEMNLEEDSIKATEELFISLVGGTLTTIVVFLPIVFINKQVKILYSGLAYTIAFSMAASLLVAVTLIPLLASRISLPKHNGFIAPETHEKIRQFWADCPPFLHRAAAFLMRVKDLIFPTAAPVPRGEAPPGRWARLKSFWFERLWPAVHREFLKLRAHPRRTYVHWCAWCLRYQRVISVVMAVATAGAMMMYLFVLEKDFMGTTEQNEFIIFIELPAGAKLDISDQVVREVEKVLSDTPEIAGVVKTAAARVEGWSSKVYVTLRPRAERSRSIQDIITDLRPKVADIGQQFDSFVYFSEPESSKEFLIDTFGPEYTNLRDMASGIAQKLQSVKGLTDIKLRYKP
ncbi:MAG TPA: efflux RND transporter permease subunit, partial [Elusimicrobiota bacterium]|nr:efflux RND transporter permease subunit [Elusimicrobiota bacterium]